MWKIIEPSCIWEITIFKLNLYSKVKIHTYIPFLAFVRVPCN